MKLLPQLLPNNFNSQPLFLTMNKNGKIVQVIGAVVDAAFPQDSVPEIYDAITISFAVDGAEKSLTLEVQQHIGEGLVRAVAMTSFACIFSRSTRRSSPRALWMIQMSRASSPPEIWTSSSASNIQTQSQMTSSRTLRRSWSLFFPSSPVSPASQAICRLLQPIHSQCVRIPFQS